MVGRARASISIDGNKIYMRLRLRGGRKNMSPVNLEPRKRYALRACVPINQKRKAIHKYNKKKAYVKNI